jgi:glycerol-3-phosphate dehydrogenase (NAD(P)+)
MNLSIIGLGSWGTALAQVLSSNFENIIIYGRDENLVKTVNEKHVNEKYLPDIKLSKKIIATTDVEEAITNSQIIIIAIPAQKIRRFLNSLENKNFKEKIVISASKGIDIESLKLVSQIINENLNIEEENIFVLSGPSFAKEVAIGLPTAVTLAGEICKGKQIQKILSTKSLRLYITEDVAGVEIAGAVKNVISIATGISDGLNLGNNARAALITRGLYETIKIVNIYQGKTETLFGLAGVGDLVLTTTGELSRNRRFGFLIGKGYTTEKALKEIGQVVEGIETVKALKKLKDKFNLELPISETVYKILYEGLEPKSAISLLMNRQLKKEFI